MSNPLSKLLSFLRTQISGAPLEHVQDAVKGVEEHVEAEIRSAVDAVEAKFEARIVAIEKGLGITPPEPPAAAAAAETEAPQQAA
ncbi:hypothetical protein [Methylobacterium brachythecii]|uniref:Uncharacterized protein (UPF0254 family) n=1 Tax=Methylobacterium brachythecii TaxID=1176177 RepID=A0A7W6AM17_9HYPH|nr:hypothetical protein [Methylobacterium brachythecii]MBB3905096.1 uncharacterized protein (UPF0254 family) [Methylobacterium brachythecii]GLS44396.1 hypothetical protein GCM10007884_23840 [Methylobacterium brachythecii]